MSWPGLRFAGIARTLPQSGGSLKWRLARELSSVCDSLCGRVGLGLAGPFLNLTPEDSEYLRGGALQWVGPHTLKARPLGLQDPLYREGVASGGEGEPSGLSAEELQEAGLAVGLAGALLEGALGERAQAEGACEVIRVEAAAQGRHAAAGNGRPHVAHSEPRRAWKWFSHNGRPSCSKKLPPEKGAKHSLQTKQSGCQSALSAEM